jgi:hypothetical protein
MDATCNNGKNPWFPQGCKSQCSHTLKTANIKSCYDPVADSGIIRPIIVLLRPYHTQKLLQASIEEGDRKLRAYSTLTNLKANYPLQIIVLIKLITPPFTVSCCNDKQLDLIFIQQR